MSVNLLIGETRTGLITATIPVTAASWTDVLNNSGSVNATVTADVVRDFDLRQKTHGARSFLAFERDGRIKAAGPIWSRPWDFGSATQAPSLNLGASGIWSLADKRVIYDKTTLPIPGGIKTFTGSLGGIAVSMIAYMLGDNLPYSNLPIVLPTPEAGGHVESFPRWELSRYGEQLRQLTQRATDAPDIRFTPRRRADDPRYIEWVMQVGTEAKPSLSQGGPDWVFDASAPKSPVLGISTDEDATQMAESVWATGNGTEEGMKMSTAADLTLLDLGWPLMEVDESHPTVEDSDLVVDYANSLLGRSNRPIEVYKVQVRAEAAAEVLPGDYCRVITKGDVWLGDMDKTMRIKQISGDLGDTVSLEMFPLAASL